MIRAALDCGIDWINNTGTSKDEKLDALCLHLYDQARLAHGSLDAEGLKRFLKYNSELLTEVAEKLK